MHYHIREKRVASQPLYLDQSETLMILDTLANADRYASLHSLFPRAFEYLRTTDLKALAQGRHPVIGERLIVIAATAAGRDRSAAPLECHRKYIDIQFVLEGVDEMGWKAAGNCLEPIDDYNSEKDIQFFQDVPASWIATPPGAFCIFFPEDAHAPLVSEGAISKIILKIAVE